MTVSKSDPEFQAQVLKRLDRFSYWTDSNFRVPFTRFRFGLSPVIGLVPVIGDAFDAIYKANTRNTELLRGWLHEQLDELPKKRFPWWTLVWLSALLALLVGLIILMVL